MKRLEEKDTVCMVWWMCRCHVGFMILTSHWFACKMSNPTQQFDWIYLTSGRWWSLLGMLLGVCTTLVWFG